MNASADQPIDHRRPAMKQAALATYVSYVGVSFVGLLNVLIVARALGPTGRGEVTFLMTVAGISGYVFNLSLHEANANFSGVKSRLPALGTNSVILSGLLGAAAAAAAAGALAYAPFLSQDVPPVELCIALVSIPAVMLETYLVYLARGTYHFGIANAALLSYPLLALAGNVAMALAGVLSVTTALAAWVAGHILAATILVVHHWRTVGYGRPDAALARESVAFGSQSHVGGVLATGSYKMDQWILGAVAGPRELGLYAVAVAWFEGLFILPQTIAAVARPDLVRAEGPQAGELTARLFRATFAVTLLLVGILVVAAPILCEVVFGSEFRDAVGPLRLLAMGAFGVSAAKLIGIALIAQRRPLLESASMGTGFLTAIVLYVLLIPPYGAAGAAIGSTIAYTVAGGIAATLMVATLKVRPSQLVPRLADVRYLVVLLAGAGRSLRRR